MNVLFHTTTAIGIAVLMTDTKHFKSKASLRDTFATALFAFVIGVISHGALDYIPHCYPIPSKIDVIMGLGMIMGIVWVVKAKYRLIVASSFFGCIFSDLVDLLPAILNKYAGLQLPIMEKLFPWHWHDYSGSIYTQNCGVSTFNHILLVLTVVFICWFRRRDLVEILGKGTDFK